MKFAPLLSALCLFSLCAAPTVAEEQKPAPAPNGLEIPEGFENWAVDLHFPPSGPGKYARHPGQ